MQLKFQGAAWRELLLYIACGALATLTDAGILWLLESYSGWYYLCSAALSFAISVLLSYLMISQIIFPRYQRLKRTKEIGYFLLINVFGLTINLVVISLFSEANLVISKPLAIVAVAIGNFLAKKLILFNNPHKTAN